MSVTTQPAAQVPPELDSPGAKLVYLYLSTDGAATVGELQSALGMTKIALYGILQTLGERGLVDRDGQRYRIGGGD